MGGAPITMLNVKIKTWYYESARFQITAYADPERKLFPVNICTADGFKNEQEAMENACAWLDKNHGGHWQQIA